MKTFRELVGVVHTGATEQGIDLSPSDVGWIVSTFLEGVINEPTPLDPAIKAFLQAMADAAAATKSEM